MNKLPREIILIISKMHPLLIPPFTNDTLRRAVEDYLAGGARKKDIVGQRVLRGMKRVLTTGKQRRYRLGVSLTVDHHFWIEDRLPRIRTEALFLLYVNEGLSSTRPTSRRRILRLQTYDPYTSHWTRSNC